MSVQSLFIDLCEWEAILIYRVISRSVRATRIKQNKNKNKIKKKQYQRKKLQGYLLRYEMQAFYRLSRQISSVDVQNADTPWANVSQDTAYCPTLTLTRQTGAAIPWVPIMEGNLQGCLCTSEITKAVTKF